MAKKTIFWQGWLIDILHRDDRILREPRTVRFDKVLNVPAVEPEPGPSAG